MDNLPQPLISFRVQKDEYVLRRRLEGQMIPWRSGNRHSGTMPGRLELPSLFTYRQRRTKSELILQSMSSPELTDLLRVVFLGLNPQFVWDIKTFRQQWIHTTLAFRDIISHQELTIDTHVVDGIQLHESAAIYSSRSTWDLGVGIPSCCRGTAL